MLFYGNATLLGIEVDELLRANAEKRLAEQLVANANGPNGPDGPNGPNDLNGPNGYNSDDSRASVTDDEGMVKSTDQLTARHLLNEGQLLDACVRAPLFHSEERSQRAHNGLRMHDQVFVCNQKLPLGPG